MLGSLLEQRAALTRQAATVLLVRAWRSHHRANPPLAACPGHERAQEHLAIDHIRLGPTMSPINCDRGRVDNMALDLVGLEQAMEPEAVEARLLDDNHLDRHATPPLSSCPQPAKKIEQRATVAADHHMLRQLLAAGCTHRHEPPRLAEFKRCKELGIVYPDGGLQLGCELIGRHRLPPCWCAATSAYQARPPPSRMGSFARK